MTKLPKVWSTHFPFLDALFLPVMYCVQIVSMDNVDYLHEKWRYSFECVCLSVCLCVCVFVFPDICGHHNLRTSRWTTMIFGMWVGVGKTKVKVNFGPPCV